MPLFVGRWKFFDTKDRYEPGLLWASLDDASEREMSLQGDIKVLGRWHNPGDWSGIVVAEASTAKALYNWLYTWTEQSSNVVVNPIIDLNEARKIANGGQDPAFIETFENVGDEPGDGESLYLGEFKFANCEAKVKGGELLGKQTKDQNAQDIGENVRVLFRSYDIANGTVFVICSVKDPVDLFVWAQHWASMGNCEITPVLTDKDTREIIKNRPGYEEKLKAVMAKLGL